jgi:hypothetical protein
MLAKGFAAVFYGPFVKEEPAATDRAAAGSVPAGGPAGRRAGGPAGSKQPDQPDPPKQPDESDLPTQPDQTDPPMQSDEDDPDAQTGATSGSTSPDANGSVASNESGAVYIAAEDRDACGVVAAGCHAREGTTQ